MIKTTDMIINELSIYASPRTKLSRMVKKGEIFPIIKGLYETEKSTPGFLLAGSIYGPSYISFEYALSFYGLIPEAVYTVTSATFEKKKSKNMKLCLNIYLSGCTLRSFSPRFENNERRRLLLSNCFT